MFLGLLGILENLRSRLQVDVSSSKSSSLDQTKKLKDNGFFTLELALEIPNIVCRPLLADLQTDLSKVINAIIRITDGIQAWDHVKHCQAMFKVSKCTN